MNVEAQEAGAVAPLERASEGHEQSGAPGEHTGPVPAERDPRGGSPGAERRDGVESGTAGGPSAAATTNSESLSGLGGTKEPMTNEEWQRKRDWLREDMTRYRKDHPEVVEAERLTRENARLEYELTQAKAREAEHLRGSKSNQHRAIGLSVYLGGAFLVWLFVRGACPVVVSRQDWSGFIIGSRLCRLEHWRHIRRQRYC